MAAATGRESRGEGERLRPNRARGRGNMEEGEEGDMVDNEREGTGQGQGQPQRRGHPRRHEDASGRRPSPSTAPSAIRDHPDQLSLQARPASFAGSTASTRHFRLHLDRMLAPPHLDPVPSTSRLPYAILPAVQQTPSSPPDSSTPSSTSNLPRNSPASPTSSSTSLPSSNARHGRESSIPAKHGPLLTPRRARSADRERRASSNSPNSSNSDSLDPNSSNLAQLRSRDADPNNKLKTTSRAPERTGKTKNAPSCAKCNQLMTGQFVRALGTVYHLHCFRCRVSSS